ncbi:TonB-dependent receptor [Thiomicrorhabdus sp. ZW0627]|uniref:TonB-dependent receptor domain-containing protein n=1 Tax=Thiomicrorhabdus sp. ZW0627 TaxID=3039774 RepID=UPI0024373022|nr:TonB-dependent receptor [Thiomicrorhabdus sp. ZW0627]MDG6773287.1 TonB-dependent receptor [Thiomicrorhabdus sp. ZW0627]
MFSRKKLSIAILSALSAPTAVLAADISTVEVVEKKETSQQETYGTEELTHTGNTETGQILRQLNGVDAIRMGGHGLDVQIRGQQNTQLNVILDGAEIAGGCPNRMDPPTSYAEVGSYDDVTVIKGVQSLLYGAGGTGGTILFERKAPTFEEGKPYQGEISAATGSNGLTQDLNAKVAVGSDQLYMVLQGSKKSADNYKDGNGDEVRSSYESQQGHLDLGWRPDENNEFKFSYEKSRTDDALYQGASMDAPLSDAEIKRLSYEGKNLAKNLQGLKIEAYQSNVEHVMNNFELRTPIDATKLMETPSKTETTGGKVTLTSQLGHTKLDYGVILKSEQKVASLYNRYPDPDALLFKMWPDVLTEQNSVFAESTSLFRNNQKVILGLRYDQVKAEARDVNMMATNLYTNANSDYSGKTSVEEGNLNALARYERGYDNGVNWFAGISHTTRTADATERFMNKGGAMPSMWWVGNPDLNPEKHNQIDIGVSRNTKAYDVSATAYYDQVEDYILRTKNAAGSAVYINKDATIYGLELAATYFVNHAFKTGFNAALTKGDNTTDNTNLASMTPLSGNVFAEYYTNKLYAGGRFNFATEQDEVYDVINEKTTPAWSTVDLYAGYNVNKTFALSAGVDNLFDHAYYNHINREDPVSGNLYKVNEPGRNVWAKVTARF